MLMRWESDSRYYAIYVQRDLFGVLTLRRVWGGKISRRGGAIMEVMPGDDECLENKHVMNRIRAIAKLRQRHGCSRIV